MNGRLNERKTRKANKIIRRYVPTPLLRKDFIVHEYQIAESKAMGADVVLLIAASLSVQQVQEYAAYAKEVGLEVLLEIHDENELNHICKEVDIVGVNNRSLKTFEVDIEQSIRMANKLGNDFVKIAESGISNISTLKHFKQNGFQGFLIGENFMKTTNPALAIREFVEKMKNLQSV